MTGQVTPANGHAFRVGGHQRQGDAQILFVAQNMVRIVELEGKTENGTDRPQRDIALRPVDAHAKGLLALVPAVTDHAAVGHGGGVRAGIGAGQTEGRDFASVGEARQIMVLLLVGAEQHQQFARPQRVGHDHGDGGRRTAGAKAA